jgi:ABC-2 type transport system ATP-binding protein
VIREPLDSLEEKLVVTEAFAIPDSTAVAATTSGNGRGEPALEIRNLHRFFGKLKAVNNISFKAYPGQVRGFIGPATHSSAGTR